MLPLIGRRKFLQLSALTAPLLAFRKTNTPVTSKPLMISTWDEGKDVNAAAWDILNKKGRALDAIEAGAKYIENKTWCCVGLSGYPDRDGIVTLDACIMDEHANCGAVAGLEQIRHPLSVARKVMETTPHILLVGNGAQQFAIENGFTKESPGLSEEAAAAYKQWLEKSKYKPVINIENKKQNGPFAPGFFDDGSPNHDTMAMIAMDAAGNLSGGVTTSGLAFKVHGRVGDSAIIGASLFVNNEVGAAISTGVGEEAIRICGTHTIVEFMRNGYGPELACKKAVERIIRRDRKRAMEIQVGFAAMNKKGEFGGYSVQEGFVYAVKNNDTDRLNASKYFFKQPAQ